MEQSQISKTKEYKEFFQYAKEFVRKDRISISKSFIIKIQNSVIESLGLSNINQLRDRYEGQVYMDNILLKFAALYILERHLSTCLIEYPINFNDINDICSIQYKKKKFRIISFYNGKLPLISDEPSDPLIFCSIQTDFMSGSVYGYLENYDLNDKELFVLKSNSSVNKIIKFIGFNKLKQISITN